MTEGKFFMNSYCVISTWCSHKFRSRPYAIAFTRLKQHSAAGYSQCKIIPTQTLFSSHSKSFPMRSESRERAWLSRPEHCKRPEPFVTVAERSWFSIEYDSNRTHVSATGSFATSWTTSSTNNLAITKHHHEKHDEDQYRHY